MATDLHLDRIAQVGMMVKDLDAATAFYRDKLGVKHLFTVPGMELWLIRFKDLDGNAVFLMSEKKI